MSDASESIELEAVERAVRPLRRVLARASASDAGAVWFGSAVLRLARPLASLELPPGLDALRDDVVTPLRALVDAEGADRSEHVATAWQALARLDALLGLPSRVKYRSVRGRVRMVRLPKEQPARAARGDGASKKSASPPPDEQSAVGTTSAPRAPVGPPTPPRAADRVTGYRWDTPLTELPFDDDDVERLSEKGIETVWDALSTPPTSVREVSPVHGAGRELPEGEVAIGGRVMRRTTVCHPGGTLDSEVILVGAGRISVHWPRRFGALELGQLAVGAKATIVGQHADGVITGESVSWGAGGSARVPTYDASVGGEVLGTVVAALVDSAGDVDDVLPGRRVARLGLPKMGAALVQAARGERSARARLALDEAVAIQAGLSAGRFQDSAVRGIAHPIVHKQVGDLALRELLAPLDDEAQAVLESIKRGLKGSEPSSRLLHGPASAPTEDVAFHAILTVSESRTQVLVVAPDGPSAQILFDRWEPLLRSGGVVPVLLAGEPRKSDRDALRRGEMHVVIATPGVWEQGLEWRRLGLVVAFEQATYGDAPVRCAGLKSPTPDLLVVARSPLPPTVWWGAYPSMDASWLGSPSADKAAVGTVWPESQREEAYAAVAAAVADGRSALVAFPMRRGGTDLLTLRELDDVVATLRGRVLDADTQIATFHGAQTGRERARAWTDFAERRARVLVATTMVEWMPPAPRGVVALVEHADRADSQRLLSLRSWITDKGHLHYVVGAEPNADGAARVGLQATGASDAVIVSRHPEGFRVAPAAGAPLRITSRWLDPDADASRLRVARDEVHALLREDPQLRKGAGPLLSRWARAAWARLVPDVACPLPETRPASGRRRRRRRRR